MNNLAKYIKAQQEKVETIEDRFLAEIDKYLRERKPGPFLTKPDAPEERAMRCFSSTSYYRCPRYMYYRIHNVKKEKKDTALAIRRMDIGTVTHNYIQDAILDMSNQGYGIQVTDIREIPTYGRDGIEVGMGKGNHPIEVTFHDTRYTKKVHVITMCDGILEFENKYMVFEFKTINTDSFQKLIRPLADHLKQGALYYLLTEITRVMFLYMDKNTQKFKAYLVEYTEEQREWVINRLRYVEEHFLNNTLPPREETSYCRWCDYKKSCGRDFNPDKENN